jgi:ATP-dependent helicase/nuclease subunit B
MLSNPRNQYQLSWLEQAVRRSIAAQRAAALRGSFTLADAAVGFGAPGAVLPPLVIETPAHHEVHVTGRIDRIDVTRDDAGLAAAVFDYHTRAGPLNLTEVYYGLSLRLAIHLLVVASHGQDLLHENVVPAGAFSVAVTPDRKRVDHPDKVDTEGDAFELRHKPRGIFDGKYLTAFDKSFQGGESPVVVAGLNKDGSPKARGDAVADVDLNTLLSYVRASVGRIADQVMAGRVEARPYRMGTDTPCPSCAYRSVCRFDPSLLRYNTIKSVGSRADVFVLMEEEAPHV